eukprot:576394-Hanusia_phi.AAC.3
MDTFGAYGAAQATGKTWRFLEAPTGEGGGGGRGGTNLEKPDAVFYRSSTILGLKRVDLEGVSKEPGRRRRFTMLAHLVQDLQVSFNNFRLSLRVRAGDSPSHTRAVRLGCALPLLMQLERRRCRAQGDAKIPALGLAR